MSFGCENVSIEEFRSLHSGQTSGRKRFVDNQQLAEISLINLSLAMVRRQKMRSAILWQHAGTLIRDVLHLKERFYDTFFVRESLGASLLVWDFMSDWKLCDFKERSHFSVFMRQRERKSLLRDSWQEGNTTMMLSVINFCTPFKHSELKDGFRDDLLSFMISSFYGQNMRHGNSLCHIWTLQTRNWIIY